MTKYAADVCALTLADAGQNSVGLILLAFTFLHPNTAAQESNTGHPLAKILKNKPNKNAVKYQKSLPCWLMLHCCFLFPNILIIC